MGSQLFTTTGSNSWNWPTGVTTCTAEAIGGGGAGGAATGTGSTGGGGKGGGYAKQATITKGVESALDIVVGTGGVGGAGNGGNGAASTVIQNSTTRVVAQGGVGAVVASTNSSNSAGSTTTVGTATGSTTNAGGNGGTGAFATPISGAGGGSGGPTSVGGNASGGTAGTAGTGNFGDGVNYSSAGAAGVTANGAGNAAPSTGTDYGGGGSGGYASGNPNQNGGSGRQGVVLITWTDPPAYAADQTAFRFYDDGSESGAVATQTQGTDDTVDVSLVDVVRHLRVRVQETGGGLGGASTDDYQLYYSRNSGTYTLVASGEPVVPFNSGNVTEGAATTNRLTGGTGSFVAGKVSEDGEVNDVNLTASNFTELVYSIQAVSASLTDTDTLDFKVYRNGSALAAYTDIPRITVVKLPLFAGNQTAFRFYEDGTESGSVALEAQNTNIIVTISAGGGETAISWENADGFTVTGSEATRANSGAYFGVVDTVNTLTADGYFKFKFTAITSTNYVTFDDGTHTFAIGQSAAKYDGSYENDLSANTDTVDYIKIERISGTVKVYKNTTLIYTFANSSSGAAQLRLAAQNETGELGWGITDTTISQ